MNPVIKGTTLMVSAVVLTFVLAALLPMPPQTVDAQGIGTDAITDAYAFESITVSTVAVRISAALVAPTGQTSAKQTYCTVLTNPLNIRFDGTDPTAGVGHTYAAGTNFSLWGGNNIRRLRAIRTGAADATLQCTLSR